MQQVFKGRKLKDVQTHFCPGSTYTIHRLVAEADEFEPKKTIGVVCRYSFLITISILM
jgi:hypothetical protein